MKKPTKKNIQKNKSPTKENDANMKGKGNRKRMSRRIPGDGRGEVEKILDLKDLVAWKHRSLGVWSFPWKLQKSVTKGVQKETTSTWFLWPIKLSPET